MEEFAEDDGLEGEDSPTSTSATERELQHLTETRLQYEQGTLIKRMDARIEAFDEDLAKIIKKKRLVAVEIKHSELAMIALYEELQVIRATQEEEDMLISKVKELAEALNDIDAKVQNA